MPVSTLRSRFAAVLATGGLIFGSVALVTAYTPAAATERVSLADDGSEPNANVGSGVNSSDTSADGSLVVFDSYADNLVAGDANGTSDVFLRDRVGATTELISVDSNEVQGNDYSLDPSISGDGRYVAFTSSASNLVPAGAGGFYDVYVRDRTLGTTVRVSDKADGSPGSGGSSSLSADGRYVAFASETPLVPEDTNGGQTDVYVHDRDADADGVFDEAGQTSTVLISVATDGTLGNGWSNGRISPNGRFVVIFSTATTLIADDQPLCVITNPPDFVPTPTNCMDVFLRDRDLDGNGIFDEPGGVATTLVSSTSAGVQGDSDSGDSDVANDGDVAFWSNAANLGSTHGDPYVKDHQTGLLEHIGLNQSNGPSMSDDGRFVAFDSSLSEAPGDANNTGDAYVYDRQTGTAVRASVTAGGSEVAFGGLDPVLSGDGRHVIFASYAPNLVSGDTLGWFDMFAHDMGAPSGGTPTDPGTDVVAAPVDPVTGTAPVTLTFPTVTGGGTTTLTTSSTGPTPPGGFSVGDPPTFFDISTTATFTGAVEVCIDYSGLAFPDESLIRLYHFVLPSGTWADVTTSLDTATDTVCGSTTSFSPFAVLQAQWGFTGFAKPIKPFPELTKVDAGEVIDLTFGLGGDRGLAIFANGSPKTEVIACGSSATVAGTLSTVGKGTKPVTYDRKKDRYTYSFKTDKKWAKTCRQLVVTFTDGTVARANIKFGN